MEGIDSGVTDNEEDLTSLFSEAALGKYCIAVDALRNMIRH